VAFSTQVKGELARYMPEKRCCQLTELGAILALEGRGVRSEAGWDVEVTLTNTAAARKAFLLFKQLLGPRPVQLGKAGKVAGRPSYVVRIPSPTEQELEVLRSARRQVGAGGMTSPERVCCSRAVVRAALLCRGSFADPARQNHVEMQLDEASISAVEGTFARLGITVGRMTRRGEPVLYLKDGDSIVDLLQQTGAHQALLQYENVRIAKDVRNSINRLVNCETANVDKTVSAAIAQLDAIRKIDARRGLQSLGPKLQEVAVLRARHPYATLQELAEMTDPPVSRSTVRYRLARLMKIAEDLPDRGSDSAGE
jgi:DNA-binding protein WhiA